MPVTKSVRYRLGETQGARDEMNTDRRLELIETWVRKIGAIAMLVTLVAVFVGLGRGLRRPRGRTTGGASKILRLSTYLLISIPYFGACFLMWRPLRVTPSLPVRLLAVILGAMLYFPGMALVLWGRLTLGEMYNVSSGFGVQLYANHRLVTHGPYAYMRHPMYLGLLLAALGGLLLYRTWTLVFLLSNALAVIAFRGRREEQALAAEFGEQWQEYCRRVPYLIPHVQKPSA